MCYLEIIEFLPLLPQGTSDDEDSPILLFTGSKHDSKYSKMDAAMQLLFHTLDQIANK